MAKRAKPAPKKAAVTTKTKSKGKIATKPTPGPKAKAAAKPAAKSKSKARAAAPDWGAILRTGAAGVRKWNNLSFGDRARATIVGANLSKANLTGVKFSFVDLSGVNLTGASLEGAFLGSARFDEKTKWPKGFKLPHAMVWKGQGPDPRNVATPVDRGPSGPAAAGGSNA